MPKKKIGKHKFDAFESLKEKERELYCLCRFPDDGLPMIGCDKCTEWYHIDCLNMSKREYLDLENNSSSRWVCPDWRPFIQLFDIVLRL